jgi:hypothetical protein
MLMLMTDDGERYAMECVLKNCKYIICNLLSWFSYDFDLLHRVVGCDHKSVWT